MTVYWQFRSSERAARGFAMEHAPNLAVPEHVLRLRATSQRSRTYFEGSVRHPEVQPVADFPAADLTASLQVWRRGAKDAVPSVTDLPDEVWSLSPRGRLYRVRVATARRA
ncbi:hypothetical protein AB0A05_27300 [Streptomyces sp. NPDC046374]|uniref:hypothetical protein n=1 Tax=Streptomyces sp. NPDC046374 TaxID=3154917 RepID=UPI0034112F2B